MTEHTWLGVKAEDGARVGDLELFIFGGDDEDLATVALVNESEPHPVVFECPLSEVHERTIAWIRSIAALDVDTVALLEAGEALDFARNEGNLVEIKLVHVNQGMRNFQYEGVAALVNNMGWIEGPDFPSALIAAARSLKGVSRG